MQQFCTYGSVRGASGNWRPYRDKTCEERWPRINAKRTGPIEIDCVRLPLNPLDGI